MSNSPQNPQSGQTLVQGGSPQYVPASPPGVAVSLPNSAQGQYAQPPQYPQGQYPQGQYAQPQYQQQYQQPAPQQYQQPVPQQQYAQQQQAAPKSGRQDELLPNAGKTVYEFRGEHSEEARSGGKHQTFFADNVSLASVAAVEDRQHSNLKGGGLSSWLIGGVVVAVVGGLVAFFVFGTPAAEGEKTENKDEVVQAQAAAPTPAPTEAAAADPAAPTDAAAPTDPAAPAPAADGTPAAEGGAPATPPADSKQADPPPADPKPAEETTPADSSSSTKKSTTTKKKSSSTTKKKTEPAPEPKVPSISPSKPPRSSGLDGLPSPD